MGWQTPKKEGFDPFLKMTGDGNEILIFRGEPEEKLNEQFVDEAHPEPKLEWHFPVWRAIPDTATGTFQWEKRTVTESGENFRGELTDFINKQGWGIPCCVQWRMIKPSKGRAYKRFTITEIAVPNKPPSN